MQLREIETDWRKNPPITEWGNGEDHITGVYNVCKRAFWCSLVRLADGKIEFAAFHYNLHAEEVRDWTDVYCRQFPMSVGVTLDLFLTCMDEFQDYLEGRERKKDENLF